MKTISATLLALSLCACATSQTHRDALANEARARCESIGYAAYTDPWKDCIRQMYSTTLTADQARQERAIQGMAIGAAILANQPAPPPPAPMVLCRQSYAGVYCQ